MRNIFQEKELGEDAVVRKFRITAADGKHYTTNHYNLDAIISLGYRVKSHIATQFRIWATERLREYIVKGFTLDDERLKNPDLPFDYFEELTRQIQDIRIRPVNPIFFLSAGCGQCLRTDRCEACNESSVEQKRILAVHDWPTG